MFMDFIRETLPFLYTISELKLLVGLVVFVFISSWIIEKDIGDAFNVTLGVVILGVVAFGLLYFFLDGVSFVDTLAVTLFAIIVLAVLGIIYSIIRAINRNAREKAFANRIVQEEAEKAKRIAQEKAEQAEYERQEKICPKCGAENAVHRLKNEDIWKPYVFKGMTTVRGRRMEYYTRSVDRIKGCNQCDYRTVIESNTYDYTVREMANDGYSCPKCGKQDSIYLKDVVVKDRYASNKEVEETTARGTKTRFIKVMKILEEETYACRNCDFSSVASVAKELD